MAPPKPPPLLSGPCMFQNRLMSPQGCASNYYPERQQAEASDSGQEAEKQRKP